MCRSHLIFILSLIHVAIRPQPSNPRLHLYRFRYPVTANINKEVLAQYTEWHQNLDPSFKLLKHMLSEYLTAAEGRMLKASAKIIL